MEIDGGEGRGREWRWDGEGGGGGGGGVRFEAVGGLKKIEVVRMVVGMEKRRVRGVREAPSPVCGRIAG